MLTITITTSSADTQAFLVHVAGALQDPRMLNDRLGRSLVKALQAHFLARNAEPNKLAAPKTNFWSGVREDTVLTEVSETGATVTIGSDSHFRIHLLGGVIRPTGGRKFLTIPLIREARGLRASDYEKESGHKLFRVGRALMERTGDGDRSSVGPQRHGLLTRGGHKVFNLSPRTQMRPVYALASKVVIRPDPRALPAASELAAALQETANQFSARLLAAGT